LKKDPSRGQRDPEVPLGVPAWGSWHVPMVKVLERHPGTPPGIDSDLKALRAEMSTLGSNPKDVADKAARLEASLRAWLATLPNTRFNAGEVRSLIGLLTAKDPKTERYLVRTGWDSAAQLYLALAALHASQEQLPPVVIDPKLRPELESMVKDLAFPKGYDSPRVEN